MARDWPADDCRPLIALIDDPRHTVSVGRHRPAVRRAGPGHPRPAPAAPDRARPRRDQGRARQARRRDRRLSRHPALARAHPDASSRTSCNAVKAEFATPRRTVIVEQEGEVEDEDLIQREDMVVTVTHAGYVKRVPLSTYRTQRRGGKGRSGMPTTRRGCRLAAVRRQHPYAGAVLLLARPGLQAEGLAAAAGGAAGARQGADQHPADRAGRDASPRSCRCRRTRRPGASST